MVSIRCGCWFAAPGLSTTPKAQEIQWTHLDGAIMQQGRARPSRRATVVKKLPRVGRFQPQTRRAGLLYPDLLASRGIQRRDAKGAEERRGEELFLCSFSASLCESLRLRVKAGLALAADLLKPRPSGRLGLEKIRPRT